MMRQLLSRLRTCSHPSAWFIMHLLLALLLPASSNAATLPAGDPDHEFTVDHVTYKCYFKEKFESSNPTPTTKGTMYYDVYAVPENTDITHAAIRLNWGWDLEDYIPTDEPGYRPCQYHYTTKLDSGSWGSCNSLKRLELIVAQRSFNNNDFNTTDLAPLNQLRSLTMIFVTGGNYYTSDTQSPYHIFKNTSSKVTFYSNLTLYKGSKSYLLQKTSIGEFASSLLVENTLDKNMENCNSTGCSPKVEVRGTHMAEDSPFYTVTHDESGKMTTPLTGKFTYKVSINELVKKYSCTSSIELGADIFEECFEFKRGMAYEIMRLNNSKISEYGYKNILIQDASNANGAYLHREGDGSYFLPKGKYYIHLKYDNLDMRVEHEVEAWDAIGLQITATPHSVSVKASVDSSLDELNDGAVYGIAEINDNGDVIRFVPFDENSNATLIQSEHKFKTTDAYNVDTYQQSHPFVNIIRWSLCSKVNGHFVLSMPRNPSYDNQSWSCFSLKHTDSVVIGFDPLRSNGYISDKNKCGVIYNGHKYKPQSNESWQVEIPDLLPDAYNRIQLFYEYDGVEYVSNEISVRTAQIKVTPSVSPKTQSATVKFGLTSFSQNQGEIEYDNWKVYTKYPEKWVNVDVEPTGKNSFEISGLTPWESYILYVDCYYRRKSDGTRTQISSTLQLSFSTPAVKWNNGEAQALTTAKARLTYSTNLENMADTYVEWRRVDAPPVVQSTKAVCPVVEGRLVGVLNNLNPDVYYQFRPVYENGSTKVYGDWVGIFTGDANVWFDPEVETRPARVRGNGPVTLRGSVLPGSGEISEQGFEIWPSEEPSSAGMSAPHRAESAHRFVTCDGISMSVDISDLAGGTTYVYRTYAKVNGVIHTGNEETFDIPGTGAVDGIAVEEETLEVVGYYNLQGVRSERPFDGMNIVVYSNGKTEKRVFKNL